MQGSNKKISMEKPFVFGVATSGDNFTPEEFRPASALVKFSPEVVFDVGASASSAENNSFFGIRVLDVVPVWQVGFYYGKNEGGVVGAVFQDDFQWGVDIAYGFRDVELLGVVDIGSVVYDFAVGYDRVADRGGREGILDYHPV